MLKSLLGLMCICLVAASDVVVLNEDTFESTLKESPFVLVEFYAPWCGHCKALAPEWEVAASLLKGKATVAKIDCTIEQTLCQSSGIQGYPTIKFYKRGKAVDYQGERTAAGIEAWVLKKTGDSFTTITSADALAELLKAGNAVVGYFSSKDSAAFQQFNTASQETDDVPFAAVFDSSVASDFAADTIKVHGDGAVHVFDGAGELSAFVNDYAFPLVDKLGQKGFERFVKNQKKYFILLFAPQVDPKDSVAILEGVAGAYRKDLGFLWDLGEQYTQHASKLGFSGEKFPVVVAMNAQEKFFPMGETGEVNAETLKAFFDNLLAGKVAQHSQSQPIPEDDGPVKTVVGINFAQVVLDSANDVFLEIYAPWCGHCKTLAPIWDQLGEKLAGKSSVVIAKVDATANDIPVEIQGFPTLLYYKAGAKDTPVAYDGGRDLDALFAFVQEQTDAAPSGTKDEL
jgi:protein disulfide-isomerase A1